MKADRGKENAHEEKSKLQRDKKAAIQLVECYSSEYSKPNVELT